MKNFFHGMMYFLLGMNHLFTKGLKRFIIVPLAINLLMFSGLFYLYVHYLQPFVNQYINQLPSWLSFLSSVLFILFVISFFFMFLSMFTVFFNLIAAPLNGLLAEKVQKMLYDRTIPSISFQQMVIRSIKRQGKFIIYFLPRFLVMVILFFIPLLQPIYPILWFLFNSWILSLQYQDFAMDNNLISFDEMKQKVKANTMCTLGLGSSINLISFIPILNILSMPAAVIAGTIYYCETNKV